MFRIFVIGVYYINIKLLNILVFNDISQLKINTPMFLAKDENVRRIINEVEKLREDVNTLTLISDHVAALHTQHAQLEELVRDMLHSLNRQLSERQNSDGQLCCMEITLNTA